MEKKYRLLDETKTLFGRKLYRIQALKDFRNVKAGDLGGWVEGEYNLSQDGNCWIYDNAKAFNWAYVFGGAQIFDQTWIYGQAWIFEQAIISGKSKISGQAQISGQTKIGKNAYITSNQHYFVIENIGSRHDATTFYLDKSRNIWVSTGCFNDTLEAFEKAVVNTHKGSLFERQYFAAVNLAKVMLCKQLNKSNVWGKLWTNI